MTKSSLNAKEKFLNAAKDELADKSAQIGCAKKALVHKDKQIQGVQNEKAATIANIKKHVERRLAPKMNNAPVQAAKTDNNQLNCCCEQPA